MGLHQSVGREVKVTTPEETIHKLNELLEAERAGVDALSGLLEEASPPDRRRLFEQIKKDEAWSCAGLVDAVRRLGGIASSARGDFAEKVLALPTLPERLQLLNRGQGWVVKRIDALVEQSDLDPESRTFLTQMRAVHTRNIESCDALLARLGT